MPLKNVRQLCSSDVRSIGESLKYGLKKLGVRVSPGSDLRAMVDACEWLGRFADDAPQPGTAMNIDRRRALKSFMLIEQAQRIGAALILTENAPGASERARWLKNRFDRLLTQDSKAQDVIFEIEMAGRLARQLVEVEFTEPDILARTGSECVALACKRPQNRLRVYDAIRKASRQINAGIHPGIIIVDVEALFHRLPSGQVVLGQFESQETFVSATQAWMKELVDGVANRVPGRWSGNVMGIIFCGVVTAFSRQPSAYLYRWLHAALPRKEHEHHQTVFTIEELMFELPSLHQYLLDRPSN